MKVVDNVDHKDTGNSLMDHVRTVVMTITLANSNQNANAISISNYITNK